MPREILNRICGRTALVLSLVALLAVLSGYSMPRHPAPTDEGTAGHIFQIAVVLAAATLLLFFATADWKQPWPIARRLAPPGSLLAAAFVALYLLEHVYFQ